MITDNAVGYLLQTKYEVIVSEQTLLPLQIRKDLKQKKVVDHTCYRSIYFPNLTLSSKRLKAELLHLVVRTVPLFEADTQARNLPFTSVRNVKSGH